MESPSNGYGVTVETAQRVLNFPFWDSHDSYTDKHLPYLPCSTFAVKIKRRNCSTLRGVKSLKQLQDKCWAWKISEKWI